MLKNLCIRNYRSIHELRIEQLSRINLISGENNSGKTTLLEAVLMLSSGHPEIMLHPFVLRGMTSSNLPANAIPSIYWAQVFPEHDPGSSIIRISADHNSIGPLGLTVSLAPDDIVRKTVGTSGDASTGDAFRMATLLASIVRGDETWERGIQSTEDEIRIQKRTQPVLFPAFEVSTSSGDPKNDATCLDLVKRQKQGHRVVEALNIIHQSLKSLEVISATGEPMIWADVGYSELVPLPTVGEGMIRICRLAMGMVIARGGTLLIDEIENGIHHTMIADLWHFIYRTARDLDVQVFATTHSYECLQAAQDVHSDDLMLHRLEVGDAGHRCITVHPEQLETAVLHNLEVR
ncbi:MAG: AAA family ATPase [Spirochaetaceae bacterium]|nr:AAA family ATPase [Spirochaetaceae bacterium]